MRQLFFSLKEIVAILLLNTVFAMLSVTISVIIPIDPISKL